jgi:hypothetical protein
MLQISLCWRRRTNGNNFFTPANFFFTSLAGYWWTGKDSNLRSPQGAADLQSAGFNHSPTRPLGNPPAKTKRLAPEDTNPVEFYL